MLNLILAFLMASPAGAQNAKPQTNLYESDSDSEKKTVSFTDKVKLIREDSDGVEVFFISEKQKGAYSLSRSAANYGTLLQILETSRKPKGLPVSVTADTEKRIQSVEKPTANSTETKVPGDPNTPWDFGKIPD